MVVLSLRGWSGWGERRTVDACQTTPHTNQTAERSVDRDAISQWRQANSVDAWILAGVIPAKSLMHLEIQGIFRLLFGSFRVDCFALKSESVIITACF